MLIDVAYSWQYMGEFKPETNNHTEWTQITVCVFPLPGSIVVDGAMV